MSTQPTDERPRRRGGIVPIVIGSVLGVIAVAIVAGGIALAWADHTQRDADGYFTTGTHRVATGSFAVTHQGSRLVDLPGSGDAGKLVRIRIRATSPTGRSLFLGIARERDVRRYLENVGHAELEDFDAEPFRPEYDNVAGTARPQPPSEQSFWAESASGEGPQTVVWPVRGGSWSVLLMNADGSRGVAADMNAGANIGYLGWIWGGILVGGALLLGAAVLLIVLGATRRGAGPAGQAGEAAQPVPAQVAGAHPAQLTARLDEPLSRGLWLVKWVLVVPHVLVLLILWLAFLLLTVGALLAILFTGRYPRGIFDFNLGVLRWTWRVGYYSYSALGTDRYPPFSLGAEPDYPARLDVAYPGELHRGLVLVKWLLAFPHWLVLAILLGSGTYAVDRGDGWQVASSTGLIGLLVFFAGVALLFTSRYPRGIFDVVLGLNRWVLRVLAYVALMTDEYPPFRLDLGGNEPAGRVRRPG